MLSLVYTGPFGLLKKLISYSKNKGLHMFKIIDSFGNELYEGKTFEQHLDATIFLLNIPEEYRPKEVIIKQIETKRFDLEGFFKGFI